MSCFSALTAEQKEKNKKSKKLDTMLNVIGKSAREEIKLLLLGPGESGKSTIFKQMKIISSGGFSDADLQCFKPIIASNCITQMQVLISAMKSLNMDFKEASNKARAEKIAQLPTTADSWNLEIGKDIEQLWADGGIQKCYKDHRDKDFQLNDSANYFFDNIQRFLDPNFTPTDQDVLRARVRTTGIEEAEFEIDAFQFRMLDVGGQRSERRKWIHCFDCVTSVLFCTSLSEYDQTLREDDSQNRMKESLLLFEEIRNSPWFKSTPFMLFLNKTDLFSDKFKLVPLTVCFPDFKGKSEDDGKEFIKDKFLESTDAPGSSKIFIHYTCAVDTENIKFVFNSVRTTLLDGNLETAFLM